MCSSDLISQDKEYARRNNNHLCIIRGIYGDRNQSQKECRQLGYNKPSALPLAVAYLPTHFLRFLFVLAINSTLLFPKLFQYSISIHCVKIKYKVMVNLFTHTSCTFNQNLISNGFLRLLSFQAFRSLNISLAISIPINLWQNYTFFL